MLLPQKNGHLFDCFLFYWKTEITKKLNVAPKRHTSSHSSLINLRRSPNMLLTILYKSLVRSHIPPHPYNSQKRNSPHVQVLFCLVLCTLYGQSFCQYPSQPTTSIPTPTVTRTEDSPLPSPAVAPLPPPPPVLPIKRQPAEAALHRQDGRDGRVGRVGRPEALESTETMREEAATQRLGTQIPEGRPL